MCGYAASRIRNIQMPTKCPLHLSNTCKADPKLLSICNKAIMRQIQASTKLISLWSPSGDQKSAKLPPTDVKLSETSTLTSIKCPKHQWVSESVSERAGQWLDHSMTYVPLIHHILEEQNRLIVWFQRAIFANFRLHDWLDFVRSCCCWRSRR